jgi:predicted transcriptional regulator
MVPPSQETCAIVATTPTELKLFDTEGNGCGGKVCLFMSVRDDLLELINAVPEERLSDVRTNLEHLNEADVAWDDWETRYGGLEQDERIRAASAEAATDSGPSLQHEVVAAWLRSWGTDQESPPPTTSH